MINFDNTLKIKQFANSSAAQKILNDTYAGNEKQLYNIGQKCNTNGINNATITEVYNQNGFYYYVLSYKINKKTYTKNARQKDIILTEV